MPIAKVFLALGMHPGPLIASLMTDSELSLQSILITSAIIGKPKAWTYVGLVALIVDKTVKVSGRMPSKEELLGWLKAG